MFSLDKCWEFIYLKNNHNFVTIKDLCELLEMEHSTVLSIMSKYDFHITQNYESIYFLDIDQAKKCVDDLTVCNNLF